jgi:hypothetical protein
MLLDKVIKILYNTLGDTAEPKPSVCVRTSPKGGVLLFINKAEEKLVC